MNCWYLSTSAFHPELRLERKLTFLIFPYVKHKHRINKKGSQKDAEQKRSGNYFFYDDGIEEDDVDADDI